MVVNSTYCKDNTIPINPTLFKLMLEKILTRLFNYIELKEIPILFEDMRAGCVGSYSVSNSEVTLNLEDWDIDSLIDYDEVKQYQFANQYERMLFIFAHEIGHYIQHKKFPKWMEAHRVQYRSFFCFGAEDLKIYNAQKLEANANKIGWILFKKMKEWYLTNS